MDARFNSTMATGATSPIRVIAPSDTRPQLPVARLAGMESTRSIKDRVKIHSEPIVGSR